MTTKWTMTTLTMALGTMIFAAPADAAQRLGGIKRTAVKASKRVASVPLRKHAIHRTSGRKGYIPLETQTYRGADGNIHVAPNPQTYATGYSPGNGERTGNGYTVFNNNGGAGTAMDGHGNIRTGHFDIQPSTGRTVFVADR